MVVPVRRGRSSGGRVRGSDSDSDSFSDLLRNAAIALGLKSVNRQFVSIIDEGSPFWCDDISMKYKKCMKECGDEDCQKYQKTLSVHCRYLNPTASDIEEANRAYDAYMTNNKNECGFLTMMFDKLLKRVDSPLVKQWGGGSEFGSDHCFQYWDAETGK
ncbi:uncharacterized protein LOC132275399 isoform X2 [Cornus florida]|uniref:uncharacterized protein LOC132275399 isoform X2 n=1 Tax=Cornus florida TaxID=4283 RepID=UPI00289FAE80|nr:uncharacterized protein LOC132275399 isoform X2 [Cornus florida]